MQSGHFGSVGRQISRPRKESDIPASARSPGSIVPVRAFSILAGVAESRSPYDALDMQIDDDAPPGPADLPQYDMRRFAPMPLQCRKKIRAKRIRIHKFAFHLISIRMIVFMSSASIGSTLPSFLDPSPSASGLSGSWLSESRRSGLWLPKSWPPEGVALLSGESFPTDVSHLWIADLALRNIPVLVIDCAIRLDVFRLVDEALRRDVNPDVLLAAILVQRVFTPYHILEAIARAEKERRSLTVLLAPLKQFFDGDVGEEEGLFLLRRMVARLRSATSPFLIVEKEHYSHPSFKAIFPELEALSTSVWRVGRSSSRVTSDIMRPRLKQTEKDAAFNRRTLWDVPSLPTRGSLKR